MRVMVILNRDGGTLRTTDLDAFAMLIDDVFSAAGHGATCEVVAGDAVEDALREAAADPLIEAIVAGGGDGTVSTAAGIAWRSGKVLGVIPAGTMNLFARSLGLPLDIRAAVEALATGRVTAVDIATADGRPFVHQYSVGMQPRLVKDRDRLSYGSRIGKILASIRAALGIVARPPSFPAHVTLDGITRRDRFSLVAVSNNCFGPGHLPYADRLDAAVLGVYSAGVLGTQANVKLAADLVLGTWVNNSDFRVETAREVELHFPRRKASSHAVVDGELVPLAARVTLAVHPGALKVIVPAAP